jgi:predicted dehydrogenase/threonine dehydrogenase-like Zn-dependent dehydrogenase
MLQLTQYQKTGELRIEELPEPRLRPGSVLVRNSCSLISPGTERTSVETAQASLIGKARSRPDLVRQVLDNVQRDGALATYRKVQARLDNVKELGYSSAGVVVESDIAGLAPGDRVACAGTAYHAEVVSIARHLAVGIPDGVPDAEASAVALCAISLQGVRQADIRLGESAAVIGLGLIGLITVQLLKAQGCRVIGLDVDPANFELARALGCDDCVASDQEAVGVVESFTGGYGADAVIITASTTSSQPVELALEIARARSVVVVVGAIGMTIPRAPFYEKELELRISRSYGPGRYDPLYEEAGVDYPIGHVRWTEHRNMAAALDLVAAGKLDIGSLITHRFPIERGLEAYELITGKRGERCLGVLLEYPTRAPESRRARIATGTPIKRPGTNDVSIGCVGAGRFAESHLIPPLAKLGAHLSGVATSSPVSARTALEKFGFGFCTTDPAQVIGDDAIDAVFITTRHDSHARYAREALAAGRHVFVEKPLAISRDELEQVAAVGLEAADRGIYLAVGYNRRFSAPLRDVAAFFRERREPLAITYRVNAGRLPNDSWVQREDQGGRIVGEGCHFVDLFAALTGARPVEVYAAATATPNVQVVGEDTASIVVTYSDGSIGTLVYLANGSDSVAKEYCEVSANGRTTVMRDFREVEFYSGRSRRKRSYKGGKGHAEEVAHFLDVVRGRAEPEFTVAGLVETTLVTLAALESLRSHAAVSL